MAYILDIAHTIYRYRTFHRITGDERSDIDMARVFLENMKRGDIRTIDKYITDTFKHYEERRESY